ncbi:MAG: TetR/AcrR family transcriptional regulator [Polyangiaceae bacterium]
METKELREADGARLPRARTGGRSARVVRDVYAAAIEVFAERGYGAFSMDEVATRAGVNKTTIYRRWPTKGALVSAALLDLRAADEVTPDTGELAKDLEVLLVHKAEVMSTPRGRGIRRAILTGRDEPELQALVRTLRREHPLVPRAVLARAVERGELPPETDLELLTDTLAGALSSCAMWSDTLEPEFVRKLIALVLHGALRRPRSGR